MVYQENEEYFVYYQHNDSYRTLNSVSNELKTINAEQYRNLKCKFFMMKGYEANDKGLLSFLCDFKEWVKELKNNKVLSIRVLKYPNFNMLIDMTFKRLAKGTYEDHEPVTQTELKWWNKCYNSGIQYCKKGKYHSYGYDFKFYYLNVLASKSFMIPKKAGKEYKLKELPEMNDLQEGFYHVKIECNNDNFRKIFAFSKDNVYHFRSLYHALKHKDEFDVKIELVKDGSPNAYLYDKDDMVSGFKIFSNYRNKMMKLKELFPKNKILKHMSSSLWGVLSRKAKINKTQEEIENEKLDVGLDINSHYEIIKEITVKGKTLYSLRNNKRPYFFNIRLIPFLTAYARNKTARIALQDIDNVIRIHTDGIVFKTKHDDLIKEDFVAEEKTTGYIKWNNCNDYEKI